MPNPVPLVDVVGVGLNAMDTLIRVPSFPAADTKAEVHSVHVSPGGQVASAMVTCRRWGLQARYVGTVGDDPAGETHRREFDRESVEAHLCVCPGSMSQTSYIVVDEGSGERTILWRRDTLLQLLPHQIQKEWVVRARALLVDGHDTGAAAAAARWARAAGIPVVADLDNLYPGVEALLENVDYFISSRDFPARLAGEDDLTKTLPSIAAEYGCRAAGATLGRSGALVWAGRRFHYSPAFRVNAVDTTGAGDVFHGAFVYGLLAGWPLDRILDFSNAAAALNCTAVGARGGIRPLAEILRLMKAGERHPGAFLVAKSGHLLQSEVGP